jgi:hypothetical protein
MEYLIQAFFVNFDNANGATFAGCFLYMFYYFIRTPLFFFAEAFIEYDARAPTYQTTNKQWLELAAKSFRGIFADAEIDCDYSLCSAHAHSPYNFSACFNIFLRDTYLRQQRTRSPEYFIKP